MKESGVPPTCLLDFNRQDLHRLLAGWGEPAYRADQIWDWLYRRWVGDADEMTNLPAILRSKLAQETVIDPLRPVTTQVSRDRRTHKTLFALPDGERIETVVMHYERRHTVCVSTQVGCAIGCPFCATGQGGFSRNLTAGEIVGQVLSYARSLAARNQRLTNVVFMGMGEPMANYDATWEAARRLNDAEGFGLRARAITLSTVGLVPGIERMAREPEQVRLAVSLHAPVDSLRNQLVPINVRYPLADVMKACRAYFEATRRRVTFEYALIDGLNDSDDLANRLAGLVTGVMAKVNLIPLNPTGSDAYRPSSRKRVRAFQEVLQQRGIEATVRLRRGMDIQAGCGQLRARH